MEYNKLFDTVRSHLEAHGVDCEVAKGKLVTDKSLAKAEAKMKLRLPAELREFYQTVGDGFSFGWQSDPDSDSLTPFANLEIPTVSDLAVNYTNFQSICLYRPEEAEKYGFPYTNDPALAKRTAARMWHWLPVIEEGNGDTICLDLSDPGCSVIYNQGSWMDGGTGENGHYFAPNWKAFLIAWGGVCFQFPRDLFWPSCFRAGGGVTWECDEFRAPYRIEALA